MDLLESNKLAYMIGPKEVTVSKVVEEYPLPACSQTHEIVKVGDEMLIMSQQPNSCLVKVRLDVVTGWPLEAAKFRLGDNSCAGLHGLYPSQKKKGSVWATLQFESALLLLDPAPSGVREPPSVVQRIDLEPAGRIQWGPHTLVEDPLTSDLWVACKGSSYVLRVNPADPADYTAYECSRRPIFVAVHPTSGDVYASLDQSSKIFRLARGASPSNPATFSAPQEIDIPSDRGNTPVGLIAGADGNVWFVLLGDSSGGTGTFARISSDGSVAYFSLSSAAGATAGLIHLAFDPASSRTSNDPEQPLRVWLLGSTMASPSSVNAVFSVCLAGTDPIRVVSEDTILLPTTSSMTHRILLHGSSRSLFVTELGVSILARVSGGALWGEVASETSDSYALWGCGSDANFIRYVDSTSTKVPLDTYLRSTTDHEEEKNNNGVTISTTPAGKKRRTTAASS